MLNILPPGCRKILSLFYSEKSRQIHLREIAKLTRLNENSVYRFLTKLEQEKILKSEREGNLKKYSLRKSKNVYAILTLFDVEKYEKLPNIRKTAIEKYLHSLPQQPVFAVLFGSTAKENFRQDSDIDILIITNTRINTKKAENEADALSALRISTFQMTHNAFLKEMKLKDDRVVQSAVKTGYPLINHIMYYEAVSE